MSELDKDRCKYFSICSVSSLESPKCVFSVMDDAVINEYQISRIQCEFYRDFEADLRGVLSNEC